MQIILFSITVSHHHFIYPCLLIALIENTSEFWITQIDHFMRLRFTWLMVKQAIRLS